MKLDKLSYSFDAERYGIKPEQLEGLKLEDQVELVLDKIQNYVDEQTAEKKRLDTKAAEAFAAAKEYKRLRSKAKGRADQARSQLVTLRKDFKEKIDLINYKAEKAKNE